MCTIPCHTGHQLVAGPAIVLAYAAVHRAAVLQVLVPILRSDPTVSAMIASGLLWTLTFVTFMADIAPLLTRPRSDVHPHEVYKLLTAPLCASGTAWLMPYGGLHCLWI